MSRGTQRPEPSREWTLADLVDFEILLGEEEDEAGEASWRKEWSALRTTAEPGGEYPTRRSLFRAWLEMRRRERAAPLPGESVVTGWRWLATLGALAGTFLGGSLTGALLHYKGSEPVNVAWFLACTLGVQALLLLGAGTLGLLRHTSGAFLEFQPLRHLVSGLAWLCSTGLRRLPGEQREQLRARLAVLGRKREIYGSLTAWPILIVTQLFAVGYNVGILAILLAHVAATDLAFGWQSTLTLSPEAAHRIVAAIATPWSWFAPNPHPTLPEVIGSRFSYTDGIAVLDRSALASWWPFLAYSIAFYGLLLRCALLFVATSQLRRLIGRWTFDHEGCNALARHLTGPIIHARNDPAAPAVPDALASAAASTPVESPPHTRQTCVALVATDVDAPPERTHALLSESIGMTPAAVFAVQIDHPSGNGDALAAVRLPTAADLPVVVVSPAHRAPIKAIALFIRKVSEASGPRRELILLLVGRPGGAGFQPIPDPELQHWRQLVAVHQLRVSIERWPTS
ncbi:MAG: DUF2868 domain-containing protein [Limisphaerales bacterium]